RLVGSDIAHAVPLSVVAGLGHASMGNLNWEILGWLLMGSLPGFYLGSHMDGRITDDLLRPILAIILGMIGFKLAY
ncbi:TSUP family transporter, partial [Pseudomonas syringae group genomosp. 7]|uniref:TSUP family transporter n=1 Tax=Pseudomonas syringae group genomosp. 7 TaxID=251699 RepID=UPI00376FF41A